VLRWTGGAINSTSHVATMTIAGSTAVARFAPASEGTVHLGSNITLDDGAVATLKAGIIQATNDGMEIDINENCGVKADPEPKKNVEFSKDVDIDAPTIKLQRAGSYFTVKTGTFKAAGTMVSTTGTVTLQSGTEAYFAGENSDYGYYQDPLTKLVMWAGSKLKSDKEILIVGGTLITTAKYTETCDVTIECTTLKLDQSTIKLARDPSDFDTHISYTFGRLNTLATVNWYNSTFQAYVPAEHDGAQGDLWWSSKVINVSPNLAGNATLSTLQVFAFDDESNVVTPTAGYRWLVIESATEVKKVNNAAPTLDGDVWQLDLVGNPVKEWHVISK